MHDDSYDYFSDEDPLDGVKERIAAAEEKGYEALKEEHIADYKSLYDNVKLNLGGNVPDKATDALLAGYNGRSADPNTAEEDLYLETMYYQFGRYLLISSSREGSLPANLHGIWANGLNRRGCGLSHEYQRADELLAGRADESVGVP